MQGWCIGRQVLLASFGDCISNRRVEVNAEWMNRRFFELLIVHLQLSILRSHLIPIVVASVRYSLDSGF